VYELPPVVQLLVLPLLLPLPLLLLELPLPLELPLELLLLPLPLLELPLPLLLLLLELPLPLPLLLLLLEPPLPLPLPLELLPLLGPPLFSVEGGGSPFWVPPYGPPRGVATPLHAGATDAAAPMTSSLRLPRDLSADILTSRLRFRVHCPRRRRFDPTSALRSLFGDGVPRVRGFLECRNH
jgi:hypothetical protein